MHLQGYSNYLHFEANRLITLIVFDNLPICKSAILGRDCIVSFIPIDRQVNEAGYTSRYNMTISFTLIGAEIPEISSTCMALP
jgi:hypothetical protein